MPCARGGCVPVCPVFGCLCNFGLAHGCIRWHSAPWRDFLFGCNGCREAEESMTTSHSGMYVMSSSRVQGCFMQGDMQCSRSYAGGATPSKARANIPNNHQARMLTGLQALFAASSAECAVSLSTADWRSTQSRRRLSGKASTPMDRSAANGRLATTWYARTRAAPISSLPDIRPVSALQHIGIMCTLQHSPRL